MERLTHYRKYQPLNKQINRSINIHARIDICFPKCQTVLSFFFYFIGSRTSCLLRCINQRAERHKKIKTLKLVVRISHFNFEMFYVTLMSFKRIVLESLNFCYQTVSDFQIIYKRFKMLPLKSGLTFCGHEINCHLNLLYFLLTAFK